MNSCTVSAPNGANVKCKSFMEEAIAAIILKPDTEFTFGELDNIDSIMPMLNESLDAYILEFNGTEPTAPEAIVETTGFGKNIIAGENNPTLLAYAETNSCDFGNILDAYKGGTYSVIFVLANGDLLGARKGDLKFAGYETQVFAHALGIPGRENKTQQFRVTFNFFKIREFDAYHIEEVNWDIDELLIGIPNGLQMTPISAFASDVVKVAITGRCTGERFPSPTGIGVEIVKRTVAQPMEVAVAEVAAEEGAYNITLTKDGGDPLDRGQYAIVRVFDKTGAVYNSITNNLKLRAS